MTRRVGGRIDSLDFSDRNGSTCCIEANSQIFKEPDEPMALRSLIIEARSAKDFLEEFHLTPNRPLANSRPQSFCKLMFLIDWIEVSFHKLFVYVCPSVILIKRSK